MESEHPELIQKVTLEYLKQCFDLSEDGLLTWKVRPDDHFPNPSLAKTFNKTFAGKEAGSVLSNGYRRVRLMNVLAIQTHRIVFAMHHGMDLCDLPDAVDHIDRIKLNNSPSNLRAATHQQNMQNKVHQNKIAPGVRQRTKGKFEASITHSGRYRYLGTFPSVDEASAAYVAASRELRGEFSPL